MSPFLTRPSGVLLSESSSTTPLISHEIIFRSSLKDAMYPRKGKSYFTWILVMCKYHHSQQQNILVHPEANLEVGI